MRTMKKSSALRFRCECITWFEFDQFGLLTIQVSITLIATGFKRQEEGDGRTLQVYICFSTQHNTYFLYLYWAHVLQNDAGKSAGTGRIKYRSQQATIVASRRRFCGDPWVLEEERTVSLSKSLIPLLWPYSLFDSISPSECAMSCVCTGFCLSFNVNLSLEKDGVWHFFLIKHNWYVDDELDRNKLEPNTFVLSAAVSKLQIL